MKARNKKSNKPMKTLKLANLLRSQSKSLLEQAELLQRSEEIDPEQVQMIQLSSNTLKQATRDLKSLRRQMVRDYDESAVPMISLTLEQIHNSLLGEGHLRMPTPEFWSMHHIWKKTLYEAGIRLIKSAEEWQIDTHLLTNDTLDAACRKRTFRTETLKAVTEAFKVLRTIYYSEPCKLELLSRISAVAPSPPLPEATRDKSESWAI